MMEGIRLVGICRNLRDMTSQNFPASLIKNTGCTPEFPTTLETGYKNNSPIRQFSPQEPD